MEKTAPPAAVLAAGFAAFAAGLAFEIAAELFVSFVATALFCLGAMLMIICQTDFTPNIPRYDDSFRNRSGSRWRNVSPAAQPGLGPSRAFQTGRQSLHGIMARHSSLSLFLPPILDFGCYIHANVVVGGAPHQFSCS